MKAAISSIFILLSIIAFSHVVIGGPNKRAAIRSPITPIPQNDDKFLTIADVEIIHPNSPPVSIPVSNLTIPGTGFHTNDIKWEVIVNIAKAAWEIYKDGKPVLNSQRDYASAVPSGLNSWTDLTNWDTYSWGPFKINYKNLYSITVVSLTFNYQYAYGGRGADGKGRYLNQATVMPTDISVLWGWSFDAQMNVQPPLNLGSAASPVAGLVLTLDWKVSSGLTKIQNACSVRVSGDGSAKILSC
jgi:hypothetical protein